MLKNGGWKGLCGINYRLSFNIMKNPALSILILMCSMFLHGQIDPIQFDFSLSGKVNALESDEVLPFASVIIKSTGKRVSSNVDGYFALFHEPSDTSFFLMYYMGFNSDEVML